MLSTEHTGKRIKLKKKIGNREKSKMQAQKSYRALKQPQGSFFT